MAAGPNNGGWVEGEVGVEERSDGHGRGHGRWLRLGEVGLLAVLFGRARVVAGTWGWRPYVRVVEAGDQYGPFDGHEIDLGWRLCW